MFFCKDPQDGVARRGRRGKLQLQLLNKYSHVQAEQPMNPVGKNCFTDVKNHSDKVLMISIKFLFKDSKSGRKGEVPSLFNQKKSKYLQQFDSQGFPKSYQAGNGFYQISKASTFVQWAKKQRKPSQRSGFQLQIKKGIFQPMLHFWYKKELLN
jgi:hypothetical protein